VFLCYGEELGEYPNERSYAAAAQSAISRAHWIVEECGPVELAATDPFEQRLARSDVYVGLVGFHYGPVLPDRPDLSGMERAYSAARKAGIPRLMFLLDEEASAVPPSAVMDRTRGHRQDRFRERLEQEKQPVRRFLHPGDVEALLFEDLMELRRRWQYGLGAFEAPPPPTNYVVRQTGAERLVRLLAMATGGPPLVIGLHGPPGSGKTALAEWACQDAAVRQCFDEVVWVTLGGGRSEDDIVGIVGEVCLKLGVERPPVTDLGRAREVLGKMLASRRLLLVLDDVCVRRDAAPFVHPAARGACLITTRDPMLLGDGTHAVEIAAMTASEADALLRFGLPGQNDQASFDELARRSGNWPLMLQLLNGALREKVDSGTTLRSALEWVNHRLDVSLPAVLRIDRVKDRMAGLSTAVRVALSALERTYGSQAVERYLELAIFPAEVDIPLAVLEVHWGKAARWTPGEVLLFCRALLGLSLVQRFNPATATVGLHPLLREHLRQTHGDRLPDLNRRFLDAYRDHLSDRAEGWFSLPVTDRYLWANLAFHLREAGLSEELRRTVTDLRFVVTKAHEFGPVAVESDLLDSLDMTPRDPSLVALLTAFRQAGRLLIGLRWTDLAATLRSRLTDIEDTAELLHLLDLAMVPPHLTVVWSQPHRPNRDMVRLVTTHADSVTALAFDYAGDRVISAGADGVVHIRNIENSHGTDLVGHTLAVNAVAYDPGTAKAVTGGADGTVRLWDADKGELLSIVGRHDGAVNSVTFVGSSSHVASGGRDGTVRVWNVDLHSQYQEFIGHEGPVNSVAFDEGGQLISGGADGMIRIWDLTSGKETGRLRGHGRWVNCVVSDGSRGRVVSGGADGTVRLWEAKSGEQLAVLRGHGGEVNSVAFDRPRDRIVSGGADHAPRIWDAWVAQPLAVLGKQGTLVNAVAFDGSGTKVVVGGADGCVRLLTTLADRPTQMDPEPSRSVVFDAECGRVVSGDADGHVRVRDATSGAELARYTNEGPIQAVAWDAAHRRIAAAGVDGTVRLWAERSDGPVQTLAHGDQVKSLCFDRSGTRIASGGVDCVVRLWDVQSGEMLACFNGHDESVSSVAIDLTGTRIASASYDGTARIWDVDQARQPMVLHGHRNRVSAVEFDPGGNLLLTASHDGTVRIWNVQTGHVEATLECHSSSVSCASFDPSGRLMLAGNYDGSVRVWDVKSRRPLAGIRFEDSIYSCCWAEPPRLVVGSGLGVHVMEFVREVP